MAAVRGRSACTHSWLPFTTGSVGVASEWRLGTSLVSVARDCFAWNEKETEDEYGQKCTHVGLVPLLMSCCRKYLVKTQTSQ